MHLHLVIGSRKCGKTMYVNQTFDAKHMICYDEYNHKHDHESFVNAIMMDRHNDVHDIVVVIQYFDSQLLSPLVRNNCTDIKLHFMTAPSKLENDRWVHFIKKHCDVPADFVSFRLPTEPFTASVVSLKFK